MARDKWWVIREWGRDYSVDIESKKILTSIVLVPYQEEHSEELARIKNTDEVRKTYLNRKTTPDKLHKEHTLDMKRKKDPYVFYTVILDNKIIGELSIHLAYEFKECYLAYYLDPSIYGKGYGTILISQAIEICKKYKEMNSILAHVIVENIGSSRILEKNGFKLIKESNKPRKMYTYEYKLK